LARATACLRFASLIRFMAPSWSSFPQRPQFESSVIHLSTCCFVIAGRRPSELAAGGGAFCGCAAHATPMRTTRAIELVVRNRDRMIYPPARRPRDGEGRARPGEGECL